MQTPMTVKETTLYEYKYKGHIFLSSESDLGPLEVQAAINKELNNERCGFMFAITVSCMTLYSVLSFIWIANHFTN